MASIADPLTQDRSKGSGKKVAFAALHHRDFRIYFIATMLAMMADNIEHVISYWLLYQQFRSPVLAGFAVISHWTPFLLFSVYFGSMADRYDCRKVIQMAQVMYMGVSAAWAMLFYTDTIQIWHACALLTIHGMAGVLWALLFVAGVLNLTFFSMAQTIVQILAPPQLRGRLIGLCEYGAQGF
jgi:MFS family permease